MRKHGKARAVYIIAAVVLPWFIAALTLPFFLNLVGWLPWSLKSPFLTVITFYARFYEIHVMLPLIAFCATMGVFSYILKRLL